MKRVEVPKMWMRRVPTLIGTKENSTLMWVKYSQTWFIPASLDLRVVHLPDTIKLETKRPALMRRDNRSLQPIAETILDGVRARAEQLKAEL